MMNIFFFFIFFILTGLILFLSIHLIKIKKTETRIKNDLALIKDILYTAPHGYYFEYQSAEGIISYCSDKLRLLLNSSNQKTTFQELIKNINSSDYQPVLNAFFELREKEKPFDVELSDEITKMHFFLNGRVIYSKQNKKLFVVWFNNHSFEYQRLLLEQKETKMLSNKINVFLSALNLLPFPIEIKKNNLKFTNTFFNQNINNLSNYYWNENKINFDPAETLVLKYGQDKTTEDGLQALLNDAQTTYKHLLKELPFGVALFDSKAKLKFFNSKFLNLWSLELSFLKKEPSFSEILDKIQEKNLLLHIKDFAQYKKGSLEIFLNLTNAYEEFLYLNNNKIVKQKMLTAPQGGILILTEEK